MKKLFLALLPTMIVLGVLETAARIASTVEADHAASPETEAWVDYSPSIGWERKPGFKGVIANSEHEFDRRGYLAIDSPQIAAAPGRKKVLFLGDSNTFGFGVSAAASFVEQVEKRLPNVDAINLGVMGYTSHQGRLALERHLPVIKPDAIVISFNFNDRRYAPPSGAPDGTEEFERAYRASKSHARAVAQTLETAHLYRWLRRALTKAGIAPRPQSDFDVTQLRPRVDEASYRRNLAAMAELGRQTGIPVIFVVLGDHPLQSEHLRRGVESFQRREYDRAIAYLKTAMQSHKMFADLARLYLVRAYEARGDAAIAAEVKRSRSIYRSFTGGTVIRLDTDYQAIMREVAAAYAASLVDATQVLDRQPQVFIDFCHFDAQGHRQVGELLAPRLSEVLNAPPHASTKLAH
ncbi:MAG TPA: SGNH/GDSL hydrolase family protein [Burkholderiaceae bacterium]|nr:SGNH/GDSL hydrolase family protein [Burkholderiaceae bacterium]